MTKAEYEKELKLKEEEYEVLRVTSQMIEEELNEKIAELETKIKELKKKHKEAKEICKQIEDVYYNGDNFDYEIDIKPIIDLFRE